MKTSAPITGRSPEPEAPKIRSVGSPRARSTLIQPIDAGELSAMEGELSEIRRLAGMDFRLLALPVADWNAALSPWPAPAVFRGEAFAGKAADTLSEILPLAADPDRTFILGGYSLAGLFALWAACQAPAFRAVAAASPSVWFPGFPAYLQSHPVQADAVYLSLGDREEKARNPVMAAVGDRIRQTHALLLDRGFMTVLEWNPGNHFQDAALRTACAFAWAMRAVSSLPRA